MSAQPKVYQKYAEDIRKEYIHYPIDEYRKGRAAVLKGFMERENIFLMAKIEGHENMAQEMEVSARLNVAWEIGELEAGRLPQI